MLSRAGRKPRPSGSTHIDRTPSDVRIVEGELPAHYRVSPAATPDAQFQLTNDEAERTATHTPSPTATVSNTALFARKPETKATTNAQPSPSKPPPAAARSPFARPISSATARPADQNGGTPPRITVPPISPRLRDELAAAVIAWWQVGALPSDVLLKDGLLALEAGVTLEPSQRTLLARTALARKRGVITALRHLNDAERIGSLVHEAWMNGSLDDAALSDLLHEQRLGTAWQRYLDRELRANLAPIATRASLRADRGLQLAAAALATQRERESGEDYTLVDEQGIPARRTRAFLLAGVALAALLVVWWFWQTRTPDYGDVVRVAAGIYATTAPDGTETVTPLDAFAIDRTEVTNTRYAACYAAGVCPYPASLDAAGRRDYFLDEQYVNHPVVNVPWDAAASYCTWRGMRLPTAAEFEVAARFAPLTNRNYRFPWGDLYSSAFVVSAENFTAPALVASRSPQGDSPLGAADLSGNVAEWTATTLPDSPQLAVIKGGSYRDRGAPPTFLDPALSQSVLKTSAESWIGFRCAASLP